MNLLTFRVSRLSGVYFCALTILLLLLNTVARADPPAAELTKILSPDFGSFHRGASIRPLTTLAQDGILRPEYFPANPDPKAPPIFIGGEAEYVLKTGDKFLIEVVRFQTDSEAFSLLTLAARKSIDGVQSSEIKIGDVGTAGVSDARSVSFFRGTTFARITSGAGNLKAADELARLFAATLDKGEDELPVLVKHLPDWLNAKARTSYVTSSGALREVIANQPVLEAISFDGGTEAVIANYRQSQLLIVEFTTPQFSIDNDQRIWTKIDELKKKGDAAPTAYRRIGNYSVFVFNAPDEKTANALIDQVKYEQVVQWLGDDPHLYQRIQRYFTQTSAGVLVAVMKSSGLSLLFCLAAGALIGTMLFRHRRAQRAAAYSDAGGSVRLNLDELTGPVASRRLLTTKQPEQDSR
jgi:hypothetical protein